MDKIEGSSVIEKTTCPYCGPKYDLFPTSDKKSIICAKCGFKSIPLSKDVRDETPADFENFVSNIHMLLDSPRELKNWKVNLDSAGNELVTAIAQQRSESTINENTEIVNRAIKMVKHYESAVKALDELARFIWEHKIAENPPKQVDPDNPIEAFRD